MQEAKQLLKNRPAIAAPHPVFSLLVLMIASACWLICTALVALPIGYYFGKGWALLSIAIFLLVFGALFALAYFKIFNAYAFEKSVLFYGNLAGVPLMSSAFVDLKIGWDKFTLQDLPNAHVKEGGINTSEPNALPLCVGAIIILVSILVAGRTYIKERQAELR